MVFCKGSAGRSTLVVEGRHVRTTHFANWYGTYENQSFGEKLPNGSLVTANKAHASVDTANFLSCVKKSPRDTAENGKL